MTLKVLTSWEAIRRGKRKPENNNYWSLNLIQVVNLFQPKQFLPRENLQFFPWPYLVATIKAVKTMPDLLRATYCFPAGNDFRTWCETKLHLQYFCISREKTLTEVLWWAGEEWNIKIAKRDNNVIWALEYPRIPEIILDIPSKPNLSICIYWKINLNSVLLFLTTLTGPMKVLNVHIESKQMSWKNNAKDIEKRWLLQGKENRNRKCTS